MTSLWRVDELGSLLDDPYSHEEAPLVVAADLTTTPPTLDPGLVATWVDRLRSLPAISIGVFGDAPSAAALELAAGFDILTALDGTIDSTAVVDGDPFEVIDAVTTSAAGHPMAAVAAAELLRSTPSPDTAAGLRAESTTYSTLQAGPEFAAWLGARQASAGPVVDDDRPRLLAARDASTLRLVLDRPARHNAYDRRLRDELVEQLRAAAVDPSLDGVLWSANGPSFCSGGDLTEFGTLPDPASAHRIRVQRSAAFWLDQLGGKVRAHLHGACIGAGIELPAYCGTVLAHPEVRIQLPEVGLGLVPGAGGTVSIPRRIGRQRTCWLAVTGATIDAETARRWGLVDRLDATIRAG